jgi:hypothetical protein
MSKETRDVIRECFEVKGEYFEKTKTVLRKASGPRGLGKIEFSDA